MTHELKIWPQYFCRVKDGTKTFEVRKNDRGFQPGDTVVLREYDPAIVVKEEQAHDLLPMDVWEGPKGYTRAALKFRVGYVLPIDAVRVVFSLLPIEEPKPMSSLDELKAKALAATPMPRRFLEKINMIYYILRLINYVKIKHTGIPSRKFLRYLYFSGLGSYSTSIKISLLLFIGGKDVSKIAKIQQLTRERVRQHHLKVSRMKL